MLLITLILFCLIINIIVAFINIIVVTIISLGFAMETVVNQSPLSCVLIRTRFVNLLSLTEGKSLDYQKE